MQSALSHRHHSLEKDFHSSSDWRYFPAFAFCILHTVKITSRLSSPGPSPPLPCWDGEKWPWKSAEESWTYWPPASLCLMVSPQASDRMMKGLPYGLFLSSPNWPLWIFNEIKMKFNQNLPAALWEEGRKRNGGVLLDPTSHERSAMKFLLYSDTVTVTVQAVLLSLRQLTLYFSEMLPTSRCHLGGKISFGEVKTNALKHKLKLKVPP